VSEAADIPVSRIEWKGAVRIIRSAFPPIDLFEDIADPADWPLLISAEQKTNPRIMATIGNLDLVPEGRRVGGSGASYLMAPFTHVSTDRPSRFTDGSHGVLYVGDRFETALFETIHHHARFMARTREAPGWTSQFREIVMSVDADLHDLRALAGEPAPALDPGNYAASQALARHLMGAGSDGIAYSHHPSTFEDAWRNNSPIAKVGTRATSRTWSYVRIGRLSVGMKNLHRLTE
jgi:hypothetical protein